MKQYSFILYFNSQSLSEYTTVQLNSSPPPDIVILRRQNPLSWISVPKFNRGTTVKRLLCASTAIPCEKQWWAGRGHRKMHRILC